MTGKRAKGERHLTVVPSTPAEGGPETGTPDVAATPDASPPAPMPVHAIDAAPVRSMGHPSDLASSKPSMPAEIRRLMFEAGAPDELLSILSGFGDDMVGLSSWFDEHGLSQTPQEFLDEILADWKPLLARGTTPLDAELCGAQFLAMYEEASDSHSNESLAQLMINAASTRRPEALAMTRVMEYLGPLQIRPMAAQASRQLTGTGLRNPPWVRSLGHAQVVNAFGYRDALGSQHSLAIGFRYGRRSHVCVVLIDHDLGGGVKDCWFADDVNRTRAQIRLGAVAQQLDFSDYTPEEASGFLQDALAAQPCPVEPDQIQDVTAYLRLLRLRAALLA